MQKTSNLDITLVLANTTMVVPLLSGTKLSDVVFMLVNASFRSPANANVPKPGTVTHKSKMYC